MLPSVSLLLLAVGLCGGSPLRSPDSHPINGDERESAVFKMTRTRDFSNNDEEVEDDDAEEVEPDQHGNFPLDYKLDVSLSANGKDVKLGVGLHSRAAEPMSVTINIDVKAMGTTGSADIQSEQREETLQPGQDCTFTRILSSLPYRPDVPVLVLFSKYNELMMDKEVMRVITKVLNTNDGSEVYKAESDVVVAKQPIVVKGMNDAQVSQDLLLDLFFHNPLSKTLKGCSFTLSGSGLYQQDKKISLADIGPKSRIQAQEHLVPFQAGKKTLTVGFSCSSFKDLKKTTTIDVK